MPQVDLERAVTLLKRFTQETKKPLEIILVGGLALHYYGAPERVTADLDAEARGDVESLARFLNAHDLPADLGENISGWSIIAMPPGYRDRAIPIHQDPLLIVKVLNPVDFIVAKLRRFTEEDIQDALFVAGKYKIKPAEIEQSAETAIQSSVKDTALFLFRRNVRIFLEKIVSVS